MAGSTNFPTSLDSHTGGNPFGFAEAANFLSTTLDGAIGAADTTITVSSTTGFPSRGLISIDSEVISYTGKTATQFTGCSRGADGTTAAAHSSGGTVANVPTARNHNDLAAAIVAVETKVGIGSSTPSANTVLRGTGAGQSAFGQVQAGDITPGTATLLKIAETVVGGSAASIDFTSIPGTYRHLLIVLYGRGDAGASFTSVLVRFNGDTGNNYDTQYIQGAGAAVSSAETVAASSIGAGLVPAASAPANVFGGNEFLVPHYANAANHKALHGQAPLKTTNAAGGVAHRVVGGWWRSTSAITQVSLIPSSGNFVAGTVATLYGLPS